MQGKLANDTLIRTALRVLTCCCDRARANPDDVLLLRAAVPPHLQDAEPDFLACYVVQNRLARRQEKARAKAAGNG